jgi:hypothetical protein
MSGTFNANMHANQPVIYQIRIRGHLDQCWSDWFEGLTLLALENGDTLLTGPVVDQAALYGILKKVRDLGLSLLAVNCGKLGPADGSDARA